MNSLRFSWPYPTYQSDCMAPLTSRSAPGSCRCTAACLNRRAQGFSGLSGQSKTSQMEPGIYWYRNRSPEGDCFTRQIFLHCVFPLCYSLKGRDLICLQNSFPRRGGGYFIQRRYIILGGGYIVWMGGTSTTPPPKKVQYWFPCQCVCVSMCAIYTI